MGVFTGGLDRDPLPYGLSLGELVMKFTLLEQRRRDDTLTFIIDSEHSKPLSFWNHFDGEGLNYGGAAEF